MSAEETRVIARSGSVPWSAPASAPSAAPGKLAKHDDVHVTFNLDQQTRSTVQRRRPIRSRTLEVQPIRPPLRRTSVGCPPRSNVDVTMAGVVDADALATCATLDDGQQIDGDFLGLVARKPIRAPPGCEAARLSMRSALLVLRRLVPAFDAPEASESARLQSV